MTEKQRNKEREERRKRIMRAGLTVFGERGYAKTSFEQIAREASLSVGAIYLYFRSKEDLMAAVFIEEIRMAPFIGMLAGSTIFREGASMLLRPSVRKQLSDETAAEMARVWGELGSTQSDVTRMIGDMFVETMQKMRGE